jgi:integrase
LDGYENKGGRIRCLPVPEYVQQVLKLYDIDKLNEGNNIFTGSQKVYNESFFNTMWSRAIKKMLEKGVIRPNQTLYSFRHSASINVFNRTQSLKLVQELLGHSQMSTSLTYLRSIRAIDLKQEEMPELKMPL